MAGKSNLPWIWILEALASSDQVDITLLKDLINKGPIFFRTLGKNVKEIIALRCLEAMLGHDNGITNDVETVVQSRVEFDPSLSCEDVIRCILHEVSPAKIKKGGPELLKWNLRPFIAYKRACLPKCGLQELKDSILESTHPHAAFLKEKSGLRFERQCDHSKPIGDGDSGAVVQRADESTAHGQAEAAKGDLIPPTAENENKLLLQDTANMISLPCKRATDGLAVGNLMEPSNENVDGGDFHANAKRPKHDGLCSTTAMVANSVSLHAKKLLEDSFQPSTDRVNLAEESQLGDLEISTMVSEDDCVECVVLEGVEQIIEVEGEEFEQIPLHRNKMPQNSSKDESLHDASIDGVQDDNEHWSEPTKSIGTALDGGQQRVVVVEAKDDGEHLVEHNKSSGPSDESQKKTSVNETEDDGKHIFQPKSSNEKIPDEVHHTIIADEAKDDTHHSCEEEILSDRSEYHDEDDGIALEKQNFLSSQFTFNHDSLSVAGWTEQNLCMKCNKDSQLLVCSSSGCPLVVHEYCLGCPASYDNLGNFYCPFCAYSHAVSAYLESKNKVSLAKKELALFINTGRKHEAGKSKKKHRKRKDEKLNEGANLVEVHEKGHVQESRQTRANHGDDQITDQQIRRTISKQEAISSALCVSHNLPREEEATPICGTLNDSPEEHQGTEDISKECLLKTGMDGQQNQSQAKDNYDGMEDQGPAKVGVQQEGLPQQIIDPPEDPASLNNDAEGTSEDENDKPSSSNYHIRLRKQHHQYTYPAIPQLRRKKVPWTAKEEETLKVGVQKFANARDKNIPWKKILEFGGTVFQKGRTTIDLKDKWRNICKGSPKPK